MKNFGLILSILMMTAVVQNCFAQNTPTTVPAMVTSVVPAAPNVVPPPAVNSSSWSCTATCGDPAVAKMNLSKQPAAIPKINQLTYHFDSMNRSPAGSADPTVKVDQISCTVPGLFPNAWTAAKALLAHPQFSMTWQSCCNQVDLQSATCTGLGKVISTTTVKLALAAESKPAAGQGVSGSGAPAGN
jgi:hypothetical protein